MLVSVVMPNVVVNQIVVPARETLKLSAKEKYAYYLLGHVFNELMCLQKLASHCLPKHDATEAFIVQPEFGQAMFVFRLAAGKLWEAHLAINKAEVSEVLRKDYLPLIEDGDQRLKQLNKMCSSKSWLVNLRNGHSFHYPSFKEWEPLLNSPADWQDDVIFGAEEDGNQYFVGAESVAHLWMFGRRDEADPRAVVDLLVSDLIQLIGHFTRLLSELLSAFTAITLLRNAGAFEPVGSVEAPAFGTVQVPFWTDMTPAGETDFKT